MITLTVGAVSLFPCLLGQRVPDSPSWRLLRATEAEQIAAVKAALDQGLPPEQFQLVGLLFYNKPALVLPLVEQKIEQVLRSPSPLDLFSNKKVDPNRFAHIAASTIAETGDEEALKQVLRLVKLDEKRFRTLVGETLDSSKAYAKSHNPFTVAYAGLALGEPILSQQIAAWAELRLTGNPAEHARAVAAARSAGIPPPAPRVEGIERAWAEAMLNHYAGVPSELQWTSDPIASRLSPTLTATIHNDVLRFTIEAQQKRGGK